MTVKTRDDPCPCQQGLRFSGGGGDNSNWSHTKDGKPQQCKSYKPAHSQVACVGEVLLRTKTSANTDTGAPCIDRHPCHSHFKVRENEAETK